MKLKKIEALTMDEFIRELSEGNYDYIEKNYTSFNRALEIYQEGAMECYKSSGEEEYLSINEYFNAIRIEEDRQHYYYDC